MPSSISLVLEERIGNGKYVVLIQCHMINKPQIVTTLVSEIDLPIHGIPFINLHTVYLSCNQHVDLHLLQEVQEALKGDSIDGIKAATDALQQELMAMGQAVYAQAGAAEAAQDGAAPPPPGADAPPKPTDDNVVDAEFTDSGN